MKRKLLGNRNVVLIFVFIAILCLLAWRCSEAAEIDLAGGMSFGGKHGAKGPVLGMDLFFPQGDGLDFYAGTMLWGETEVTKPNWDWHAGFQSCRFRFCASLGAAYVQVPDALNGSHLNFHLGLSYRCGLKRVRGLAIAHLSNAGTVSPNYGRNAAIGRLILRQDDTGS